MTQIELAYTDVINVDMLESILEQSFQENLSVDKTGALMLRSYG